MSKIVRPQLLHRLARPLLITCLGTAFAGAALWSVAGMVAVSGSLTFGSGLPKPQFYSLRKPQIGLFDGQASAAKRPRLIASAQPVVTASVAAGGAEASRRTDAVAAADSATRFDAIVKQAALTPEKLAGLFAKSGQGQSLIALAQGPTAERFAPAGQAATMLAFADPSPAGTSAALSAMLTAPLREEPAASQDRAAQAMDDAVAALPAYEDLPADGPLPQLRPRGERARAGATTEEVETSKPQVLAYARPDDPAERKGGGVGDALRNLFGGTKAGNGVAVYDIGAAKVYMPDGSVLEAHSGVGKMADDPRYVNVKMNGPTPPHTYNLKMRESRFHGVEAIRMLPVDGKNKYGRDGFLTHSYLLRGRPGESHGCVAFKDYKRFLTAFKQGKVKQMIVVPSGGRATMLASNGKSV